MDREVVDALFGLLDERVAIRLPTEFLRFATDLLKCLIDRDGADGNRRISKDPFPCFVDVFTR